MFANVVGVDTQNFNPTTSGVDFVTVQSSETLEPGNLSFGFFLNYAANTLPTYPDPVTLVKARPSDRLLSSDFNFGLGLTRGWDFGFSVPSVVSQQVTTDVFKGVFDKTGLTDLRLNTKIRFFGNKDGGMAMIVTLELPQVQNNPFYGRSNAPTYNIELAADTTFRNFALGGNIGYRLRNPGEPVANVPITPIGNMWIASIAASYLFSSIDTKMIAEIYASRPSASATQTVSEISSQEFLLGFKHDLSSSFALHTGGATKLMDGTFTPDWRVYAGINWTFGPLWGAREKPRVFRQSTIIPRMASQVPAVPPTAPASPTSRTTGRTAPTAPAAPMAPAAPSTPAIATVPITPPVPPAPTPTPASPANEIAEITTIQTESNQGDVFAARVPERREVIIVRNINFKVDSAKIPADYRDYIEKLAVYLNRPPVFRRLVITGHTDSVGADAHNHRLSVDRAAMIKRALVEIFRVPGNKIEVQGHGSRRPIADNGNFQGRQLNRRVEFYIER